MFEVSLICLGVSGSSAFLRIFLSLRHCASVMFSELYWDVRLAWPSIHISWDPGMASAVTLRVNRQVRGCPGATMQDLFCCKVTTKNLQEPSPREYQLGAGLLCSWCFLHFNVFLDIRHLACQGAHINPFPDLTCGLFSHPQLLDLNWEPLVQRQ